MDENLFYIRSFEDKGYWSNQYGWVWSPLEADTFTEEESYEFRFANPGAEIVPKNGAYFEFYEDSPITLGDEIRYPEEGGEVFFVKSIMNPDGVVRDHLVFMGGIDFSPAVTIRDKQWNEITVPLVDTDMSYILDKEYLLAKDQSLALDQLIQADNGITHQLGM